MLKNAFIGIVRDFLFSHEGGADKDHKEYSNGDDHSCAVFAFNLLCLFWTAAVFSGDGFFLDLIYHFTVFILKLL